MEGKHTASLFHPNDSLDLYRTYWRLEQLKSLPPNQARAKAEEKEDPPAGFNFEFAWNCEQPEAG